ncbi:helix-turn-helix domain-containing protein [Dyadobacter sp. CY343]|uniref:helix-turn-helix domain-containing protein n=1 Tax=Dyadobacter sp. CY343 TaxID=2907299 RepID=UPI001F23E731|nr:XRE family transcriptional regulator [Dyadobacter sp. CY343]MCE7060671.1 XRE family transcriptional regulator [Dyadobacter sp. CY343]
MREIFAARFKSARLRTGLSLKNLSDKLGSKISRQALHKYEKGEVIPNSDMLALLSDILQVRPDYFFSDTKIAIGAIEYRKMQHLPSREEHKVVEQTREYLSRYLELEEILGISSEFENPLKNLAVVSDFEQANAAAELLRKSWKLEEDPLYNITQILEDKHIKVVEVDAEPIFDGMQTWVNGQVPVLAFNKNLSGKADRIRFTLLHELGHLLLDFGDFADKEKEKRCHQFAGAMLLPRNTLIDKLGAKRSRISVLELGNIKKQFGISIQAIIRRAAECAIISENYARQFLQRIKEEGWRTTEPIAYEGIEASDRFDQLLFRALSEEQISLSKAAALKNMKLAEFRTLASFGE